MINENENSESDYDKLKNNKFKQQTLPALFVNPSNKAMIIIYIFIGVSLNIIGLILLINSNNVIETIQSYNKECINEINNVCNTTIEIRQNMSAPIMVYYQLNNFYQNHRLYVKSKSLHQLAGVNVLKTELLSSTECNPVVTMGDLGFTWTYNHTNNLSTDDVANPCGLIAKSFFNDSYLLYDPVGESIFINESNIAWDADKQKRFKRVQNPNNASDTEYWKNVQWLDVEDEHFMIWMRPAGLSDFRKLWGRINTDLIAGNYTLSIVNNYNVTGFKGDKIIVLSTLSDLGGKNTFISIAFFVVGVICLLFAILFFIGYKININKEEIKID